MNKKQVPRSLFHFTCDHGHTGISQIGVLLPNLHPLMPGLGPLLWLTDVAEPPSHESVGLTSRWTSCDRLAYRYHVETRAAVHWEAIRMRAPKEVVTTLEAFSQPEHWWVVRRPLTSLEFSWDATWKRQPSAQESSGEEVP